MKNDDEIIASLIAGGVIGAAIGALLSDNKDKGATLGGLIGATMLGTYKANEKARATQVPMVIEENGKLYEIQQNGVKKFLRSSEQPTVKLQKHFKLN